MLRTSFFFSFFRKIHKIFSYFELPRMSQFILAMLESIQKLNLKLMVSIFVNFLYQFTLTFNLFNVIPNPIFLFFGSIISKLKQLIFWRKYQLIILQILNSPKRADLLLVCEKYKIQTFISAIKYYDFFNTLNLRKIHFQIKIHVKIKKRTFKLGFH